jgi:hypothetical protein
VAVGKGNSHRRQMTVCVPFADCLGGSRQRFFLYLFFGYKNSLPTVYGGSRQRFFWFSDFFVKPFANCQLGRESAKLEEVIFFLLFFLFCLMYHSNQITYMYI